MYIDVMYYMYIYIMYMPKTDIDCFLTNSDDVGIPHYIGYLSSLFRSSNTHCTIEKELEHVP